jgi:hypothetical protein
LVPVLSDPLSNNGDIHDQTILWRYMSLDKYLHLITKSVLWFSRIDLVGDRFEGSTTHASFKMWKELFETAIPESHLDSVMRQIANSRRQITGFGYANCWHECDSESMQMWRMYSDKNGVAVRTTFGDFRKAFNSDRSIFVNRVNYLNYAEGGDLLDDSNLFSRINSRPSYLDFEREVRATFLNPFESNKEANFLDLPTGFEIKVDLNTLINFTVIKPEADMWLNEVLLDIHSKYNLEGKLQYSEFEFEPIW